MIVLKNVEQIEGIRKSCKRLALLHEKLRDVVVPGITTGEIDRFCYDFITGAGDAPAFLGYMDFPASACISVNEEIIHGIPAKRIIKEGDLVSIDLGIIKDGYYSDAAQTIAVGACSPEANRLNEVTKACLSLAVEQVKPGNRIHDISRAVFRHAKSHGFEVVREYCGHGVGLQLHEEPQIPNYVSVGPNPRLRQGMVLAIEPMVNMGSSQIHHLDDQWTVVTRDGKPSAHWEHTVLVTEDGAEILTAL
jgi:methionyl aminopeptidase